VPAKVPHSFAGLRIRRYNDEDRGQLQVKFKDGFAVAKLKADTPWSARPPERWPPHSVR